jgi:16S rRNA processing protein RimM
MVVMGHVSAPFGVFGWIKVQPYTEEIGGLLDYPSWWLGKDGNWREYPVEKAEAHSKAVVAKLKGLNYREAALLLKGCQVAVPRGQFPKTAKNEYYWTDLIGLDVVNTEGIHLGTVKTLLETGANDVLVLEGDRERLIPFISQAVLDVDIENRVIRVDWGVDY